MVDFVHLHVHSEFSLLDGLGRVDDLTARAKELDMPALALTDHGVMFGVIDFYRAAKKHGIKPIIGLEAYVARRGMQDRDPQLDKKPYHLILLAENDVGYQNLLQIASAAQLNGFYYKPRVDREYLASHAEGLIALSSCAAGEVPRLLLSGRPDKARAVAEWYRDAFGPDNYYLELQLHEGISEILPVNQRLIDLHKATGIPLVVTNDAHYVYAEDAATQDILLCIQTGKTVDDPTRMRMGDQSFYLKSYAEMARLFPDYPEAMLNTVRLAERCEVNLDPTGYHLPVFAVPPDHDTQSYLRHLVEEGLKQRYSEITERIRARVEHELKIIHEMGFDAYFLIVWDLCRFAREKDVWWNVRGSGAGSIVAYCLGITNLDPLRNNLIFERFLNPSRVNMPDIDLDYPDDRREEMIQYTIEKYGQDKVAQIITFGTLGAKAAIRDVGRALDLPLSEVDRVAKLIPAGPKVKIAKALEEVKELRELLERENYLKELVKVAQKLEGISRHAGTHAAGVVVTDEPLVTYTPLHRPTGGNGSGALTQFPMEIVDSIGLLKVDFLGLSTLTIMRRACELIEERHGVSYNLNNIPLNDETAFELLSRGDTVGVFQVESEGMKRVLRDMRPNRFEDIIAVVALYRPGPMEYIPNYINRKHGREAVTYRHPALEPILKETYAIIVYQEQIIQILTDLAGYSAGEADLVRRAVSKKKEAVLQQHHADFVQRAQETRRIPADVAEQIFTDIEYFANYGFNKCVTADTRVVDAGTGRWLTVGELYAEGATHRLPSTPALTDDGRVVPRPITAVMGNGRKPVFRLRTRRGREIRATANHPFRTWEGWVLLQDLHPGDLIAAPRVIPYTPSTELSEPELVVLAAALGKSSLCHPSSFYVYSTDEAYLADYVSHLEQFDNTVAVIDRSKSVASVYAKRIHIKKASAAVQFIANLGLRGKKAIAKFFPAIVFGLPLAQLRLLLGRLWSADGCINPKTLAIFHTTSAPELARGLHHLLLRLGLPATLHTKQYNYRGTLRTSYTNGLIGGRTVAARFAQLLGPHFVGHARADLEQLLARYETMPPVRTRGTLEIVPAAVLPLIRTEMAARGRTPTQLAETLGISQRLFYHDVRKRGFRRDTLADVAQALDSTALRAHATSDIFWDEVVSIEPDGVEETYDLTVADEHNFVANDLIVHNSHAADYAMITCQTAYLKAHYPVEYMTALLSVERNNTDKVTAFVAEARRLGFEVLGPDVNYSGLDFTIETCDNEDPKEVIRFGLGAVKNVGEGPVNAILVGRDGRAFKNLDDFCHRVDLRQINRKALECLIRGGSLDDFGRREQLLAVIERMIGASAQTHQAAEVGQMGLFGGAMAPAMGAAVLYPLPDVPAISQKELLASEKELLGVYISETPLAQMSRHLDGQVLFTGQIGTEMKGQQVKLAGQITRVNRITTRRGDAMAFAELEDIQGGIDVVVFPKIYETSRELWVEDTLVRLFGKVDERDGKMQVLCERVLEYQVKEPTADEGALDNYRSGGSGGKRTLPRHEASVQAPTRQPLAREIKAHHLHIVLPRTGDLERDIQRLGELYRLLDKAEGKDLFTLYVDNGVGRICLDFPNSQTTYSRDLEQQLVNVVGDKAMRVEPIYAA